MSHLARWWKQQKDGKILCSLCPRYCKIADDQSGFCYIRKNESGKLYSYGYGRPTGFAVDPIEKKPLNHFLPRTDILSFGTAGCNLGCKFCQNWSMSKAKVDDINSTDASAEDVVNLAKKNNIPSIAYTYNDPIIFAEYVIDISRLARQESIKSVMVTNGYISDEARADVFEHIDAANVDLKAFSEQFYYKLTSAHLQPVLDTLVWLRNETNVWIELTTLLIPGENDSAEEIKQMCEWVLKNLGDSVPLHFTAFHPSSRMMDYPATPAQTLINARNNAIKQGIKYCYVGNIHNSEAQSTYCPNCNVTLIERNWHSISVNQMKSGKCGQCGEDIEGRWI